MISNTWSKRDVSLASCAALLLGVLLVPQVASTESGSSRVSRAFPMHALVDAELDLERVIGPTECVECHEPETEVWKASQHVEGGKTLTRNPKSKEIASALGIRRVKSDARCASCHYTQAPQDDGKLKTLTEVSCESCHGGARDWLDEHNEFGGPDLEAAQETEAHRSERLARCDELGLRRPGRIAGLAAACYTCHSIADAELMEAGHPAGGELEFVTWTQGEVRHNFVRGDGSNVASEAERQALMFVIGQAVRLESGVRQLAAAAAEGVHVDAVLGAVGAARAALAGASELVEWAELEALLGLLGEGELEFGTERDLAELAQQLGASVEPLEASAAALDLAGLLPLVPSRGDYRGVAQE